MKKQDIFLTWKERKNILSSYGITYKEYLASDHWINLRKDLKSRKAYQKCRFCGSKGSLDLHHKHYRLLFCPSEFRSIISLCRKCHYEVHELASKELLTVHEATMRIKRKYKRRK